MAARRRKSARRSSRRSAPPRRRLPRVLLGLGLRLGLVVLVVGGAYTAWLDLKVRAQFEGQRWQVPARIYGRAMELFPGAPVSRRQVIAELRAAGYHADGRLSRIATYRAGRGGTLELRTRSFRFWDGEEPEQRVRLRFDGARLVALSAAGSELALLRLEPVLVGRIHPSHREDRILVRLEEVPRALVAALLAVEDRAFFDHRGVSLRGMARALLANIRAGGTVQGGSTLTQQLAKSYFLTAERSLWRKLNDVLIALILEARYDKDSLLEAYLNEVYLGQDGPRAVHGFGLAARHFFDRRLDELTLTESALLAALVRGPSFYNPRRHPERARKRRDLVLQQMADLGIINAAQLSRAQAAPLGVTREPGQAGSAYPGFLDLVRRQLRRDYRDEDLRSEGLRIFTTLDPTVQDRAQSVLTRTLAELEDGKRRTRLQGALVVTEPQSGEVLAVVGSRNPREAGFNRALDARRPVGSLVKPAVYLAALSDPARWHLASPVEDAPIELRGARGELWSPSNYDGEAHGPVPLMEALAQSYNLATVRLGMDVGLDEVVKVLRRLGVERDVKPYPSLLLGALELSPMEVARMYQTIAGGGFRQPLRAIRDVTDAAGAPLERYGVAVEEAVDPRAVYLVVRAMQEVMRSGTGRRAGARLAPELAAAGKTGTTDDLRDSWFAGFAGDRLAVAWIGRDDNRPARLTGASGALVVWSRLLAGIPMRGLPSAAPAGILFGVPASDPGERLRMVCAPQAADRLPFLAPDGADSCAGAAPAAWPAAPAAIRQPSQGVLESMERRAEEAN